MPGKLTLRQRVERAIANAPTAKEGLTRSFELQAAIYSALAALARRDASKPPCGPAATEGAPPKGAGGGLKPEENSDS